MDRTLGQALGRVNRLGKWWGVILAAIVVALVAAWIDGGEEPLRPIVEPIDTPELSQ